jgi:hypothetical protein
MFNDHHPAECRQNKRQQPGELTEHSKESLRKSDQEQQDFSEQSLIPAMEKDERLLDQSFAMSFCFVGPHRSFDL